MKTILWLILTCNLWSNDGGYTMSGNHLIPVFESNIPMTKEILTIKREKDRILDITVEYTFFNPSTAKTILVGFEDAVPLGDIDTFSDNGEHPYMKDFLVTLNKKKLSYKVIDYTTHMLSFMQKKVNIESLVAKDKFSDSILRNLPYARRGYVFQDKRIQKYYEAMEWYEKKPAYKANQSDLTREEKEFEHSMKKQKLYILKNLPYAKRGHVFKRESLKTYFEAQKWYKKEEYSTVGTLELTPAEKKWLNKIKSINNQSDIAFYILIDEYEKIFEENSNRIIYLGATNYPVPEDAIETVKDVNASMFEGSYHFGESEGESIVTVLWKDERLYGNETSYIWDDNTQGWKQKNICLNITFEDSKLKIDEASYELYRAIRDIKSRNIKKDDIFIGKKNIYYHHGKTHLSTQLNLQGKIEK